MPWHGPTADIVATCHGMALQSRHSSDMPRHVPTKQI